MTARYATAPSPHPAQLWPQQQQQPLQQPRQFLPTPQPQLHQYHPLVPPIVRATPAESVGPSPHQQAYLEQKVMATQASPLTLPPDGPALNRLSGTVAQTDSPFEIPTSTDVICNRLDQIMEELLGGEFPIFAPWQMTTYRQVSEPIKMRETFSSFHTLSRFFER